MKNFIKVDYKDEATIQGLDHSVNVWGTATDDEFLEYLDDGTSVTILQNINPETKDVEVEINYPDRLPTDVAEKLWEGIVYTNVPVSALQPIEA